MKNSHPVLSLFPYRLLKLGRLERHYDSLVLYPEGATVGINCYLCPPIVAFRPFKLYGSGRTPIAQLLDATNDVERLAKLQLSVNENYK